MGEIGKLHITGKLVYALAFCVVLPLLMVIWAMFAPQHLPAVPEWGIFDWLLTSAGGALLTLSMLDLWNKGQGLPMNAFPPKNFVSSGTYGLFRHPIYIGACWISFGISMITENAFAFWIISPVLSLSCIALVWGFERQHIRNTFGEQRHIPFFALPPDDATPVTYKDRLRILLITYIPWIVFYQLAISWGNFGTVFDTRLSFETWPVIEEFEWIYISIYPLLFLIPFLIQDRKSLINFTRDAWWSTALGMFLMFTLPFYCSQTEFIPDGIAGDLLAFERSKDSVFGALPSFHVIWALLAGRALALRFKRFSFVFYGYAFMICIACYFTGMHALLDILSGVVLFGIVVFRSAILNRLQEVSQNLANSWKEWKFGHFRIINHAIYSGLCSMVGLLIGYCFIENAWYLFGITAFSLICAGLWGQFIEGSQALLRPFGYYGCIIGAIIGCALTSMALDFSGIHLLAIFALAAPFVQGIGRLRCLVQGCCHGKRVNHFYGIIVNNPRSRVCQISHLKGKPIHNTQLYSIISNALTAFVLWKLWFMQSPASMIVGAYLICNGLGRFVEESFRGEAQTRILAGLRIYQWASLGSVAIGAAITTLPSSTLEMVKFSLDGEAWLISLSGGLFTAFLLSMDFPHSNRRFSRLSG